MRAAVDEERAVGVDVGGGLETGKEKGGASWVITHRRGHEVDSGVADAFF